MQIDQLGLFLLFLIGTIVGGQINRGIYCLAWKQRRLGPWATPHEQTPTRQRSDLLPVIGWFGLRREVSIHGKGFWIRPLLLELFTGSWFAALYWWEVSELGLYPQIVKSLSVGGLERWEVHYQYLSHVILFALMLVATFIDFDEQTIPDAITIPGTLIALFLAGFFPQSSLPNVQLMPLPPTASPLLTTSPNPWKDGLDQLTGLGIGVAIVCVWGLAIVPRTWTTRYGILKAFKYAFASIRRYRTWIIPLIVAVIANLLAISIWWIGDNAWRSLFSSLVGLAFGGGLIWAVRIVGKWALRKEAMGFGDVTLMAMIGAFLGWQAVLLVFFLAPVSAIFVSIVQWIVTRRRDIAFGPYLCFGAVIVVVVWDTMWKGWAENWFELGSLIPAILVVCLGIMGVMLLCWRGIEERLLSRSVAEMPQTKNSDVT